MINTQLIKEYKFGEILNDLDNDEYFDIFNLCNQIVKTYNTYISDASQLHIKYYDNYLSSTLSKYVTGDDRFASNEIHEKYLKDIKTLVDDLVTYLEKKNFTERSDIALSISNLLLNKTIKEFNYIEIVLIADDLYCLNLLKYINIDELKLLYIEYDKNYPIKLDNQKSLFNEMKSLLKIQNNEKRFKLFKK